MWAVTRARVTGRSHEQNMLPCQDFAEHWALSECLLCVVSDGASDACLGEVGASIAAESLKRYFSEISFKELQSKDYVQINQEIKRIFDAYITEKSRAVKFATQSIDYAATAAFIAIYEEYDYFLFGVIGDCTILAFDTEEKCNMVCDIKLQKSFYRPDFISDESLQMEIGSASLSGIKGFILSTDGCAKAGLVSFDGEPVPEAVTSIFNYLPNVQNPQIWLEDFISRNFSKFTLDDLSMCVAYQMSGDYLKEDSTCIAYQILGDFLIEDLTQDISEVIPKISQKNNNRKKESLISFRRSGLEAFVFHLRDCFNKQDGKRVKRVGKGTSPIGMTAKRQKPKKNG